MDGRPAAPSQYVPQYLLFFAAGQLQPGCAHFSSFFSGIQTPFASVLVSHTSGDTQRLLIGDGALVRVPSHGIAVRLVGGSVARREGLFRRFVDTGVPIGPKNLLFGVEPAIEVGARLIASLDVALVASSPDSFFE